MLATCHRFLCDAYKNNDLTGETRSYLHTDYSLDCDSAEYKRVANWAYGLIALWPAGIPLFYFALLFSSHGAIKHRAPTVLARARGFLYSEYAPSFFLWEPIELLRKLTLTGFVLLINEEHDLARALVAVLISLIFFAGQWAMKPFKRSLNNWLAAAAHLCLTLIFLGVLLLKVCDASSEACADLGLGEGGDGIFLAILVISITAISSMIILAIGMLLHESRAGAGLLYVQATGALPDMPKANGIVYHVFLSHIWGSGQDQAATIKRCVRQRLGRLQPQHAPLTPPSCWPPRRPRM